MLRASVEEDGADGGSLGRTEVPVHRGATFPLLNTAERMRRWEALHAAGGYARMFGLQEQYRRRDQVYAALDD